MSDLRDRIAAALRAEDEKPRLCPFDGEPTMASYDRLADAVIAEMGLRRAEMGEWDVLAHGFRGYRYVTKWEADGE